MARGTGVLNEYVVGALAPETSPNKNVVENKGGDVIAMAFTFETEAADDAGSKYRLCRLNANLVPIWGAIYNDSIADATEIDLGIYDTLENGGAVKDIDAFMDGVDINAGNTIASPEDAFQAVAIADVGKDIFTLAGDSNPTPDGEYDLVLTMVSEVSAAGTISGRLLFAKNAQNILLWETCW